MQFLGLMMGMLIIGIGQGMMLQAWFKREQLQHVSWFLARAYFGLMVLTLISGHMDVCHLMLALSALFGGMTLATEPRAVAS